MRQEDDAARLLHRLLDRHERTESHTRRIMARPTQAFASTEARDHLRASLAAAEASGGVELEMDREAPHLVARVILRDPLLLYRFLDRTPASDRHALAIGKLASHMPTTAFGQELRDLLSQRWAMGKSFLALAPGAIAEAVALIRVADAAFTDLGGPVPLRTRSARLLGDSKALERGLSKLLAFLKLNGRLDPGLDREAALGALGLVKYPQPVLLAGPLKIAGAEIVNLPYIGMPPEAVDTIELAGAVEAVLTIENLESFHRHVREARSPRDIIVYTGGFPAQGVVHVLRHLVRQSSVEQIHHWGDIDVGGVRIGRYLETTLDRRLTPHLMTSQLARAHGKPARPTDDLNTVPQESGFHDLAHFLLSRDAHWLEQEMLEPMPIRNANGIRRSTAPV